MIKRTLMEKSSSYHTASIYVELALILAILDNDLQKITQHIAENPDWNLVAELSIRHRVYPIVYRKIAQFTDIPPDVLDRLKQLDTNNKLKSLQFIRETIRLVKLFIQNDIPCLVLKGMPLASSIYSDISLRPCRDIDLVIDVKDLWRVCNILESIGYTQNSPVFRLTPWRIQYMLKHKIEVGFINTDTGICIEPHWQISYLKSTTLSSVSKYEITFYNQTISTLIAEDNFIYLAVHGATHCFWRLRWLNDIALILKSDNKLKWDSIRRIAQQAQVTQILHQTLILANLLLNAPIPSLMQNIVARDKKAHKLARLALKFIYSNEYCFDGDAHHRLFYIYRYYYYSLPSSWLKRGKLIWSDLFKLDNIIKAINLPDRFSYIYYVLHPIAFIYNLFKRK